MIIWMTFPLINLLYQSRILFRNRIYCKSKKEISTSAGGGGGGGCGCGCGCAGGCC
jgi:uncharacterized membrane protein